MRLDEEDKLKSIIQRSRASRRRGCKAKLNLILKEYEGLQKNMTEVRSNWRKRPYARLSSRGMRASRRT
jgi:hypothetical protein